MSYKKTNNEKLEQRYCLYILDNLCDNICRDITGNKVLLNKYYYYSYTCAY